MEDVRVVHQSINDFAISSGEGVIAEIRRLAKPFAGLRVLHVNATPQGGGVAEILHSQVPLLRSLGLDVTWQTLLAEPEFFVATKAMHNGLQGDPRSPTPAQLEICRETQRRNAARIALDCDIVIVHDPQPLGLMQAAGQCRARWMWRLHVDSSAPNPDVWSFLRPLLDGYGAAVFTMEAFAPPDIDPIPVRIIPPAIDPLTAKNRPLPFASALATIARLGLDPGRPIVAQVSRFDPWKDPIGVIDAYRIVREAIPDVQLAMMGVIAAQDDPEAISMAERVTEHAAGDPDIHLFTDPSAVGPLEIAAIQQQAQVILQKSLREGFGLTVSEALWKATPVVGGRAGGIPLQLDDGRGGFLVDSVSAAAEKTRWLLENPAEARSIAARGRERVRDQFLITRLLTDELRLYADMLEDRVATSTAAAD